MVYLFIQQQKTHKQNKVVDFIDYIVKCNNFVYKLMLTDKNGFIKDNISDSMDMENDIVFFTPETARHNIALLRKFKNAVVILEKPTLMLQKISKDNPINENTAINNFFCVAYIDPNDNDITNDEWRIVIQRDTFVKTNDDLLRMIENDRDNKGIVALRERDEEKELNFVKQQINIENEH